MMDWEALTILSINPTEIVLRGTLMYWFLLAIFRFVLRRDVGNIGISDFKLLLKNMRREDITRDEVLAKMHEQGIEKISEAKEMRLESDGNISVIRSG